MFSVSVLVSFWLVRFQLLLLSGVIFFPFAHSEQTIVYSIWCVCLRMHSILIPMSCTQLEKLRVQQFDDTMNSTQLTKINAIRFDAIKLFVSIAKAKNYQTNEEEIAFESVSHSELSIYWVQQTLPTRWSIVILNLLFSAESKFLFFVFSILFETKIH